MSKPSRLLASIFPLVLAASACSGSGDAPKTGDPGGTGAAVTDPVRMTLTVSPGAEAGKHRGAARLEATTPVMGLELKFTVPETCRITAGAAVRTVAQVAAGTPLSQELEFECPAGTTGVLKAHLGGANVSQDLEAKF